MLEKCKTKAEKGGYNIELKRSDFRKLSCWEGKQFDCAASTGNSLPHVKSADVLMSLEQMNALVKRVAACILIQEIGKKFYTIEIDFSYIIPFL